MEFPFLMLLLIFIFSLCLHLEPIYSSQMNLQPFSFGGVKDKYNSRIHRQSRFGRSRRPKNPFDILKPHAAGVKDHAIINGEYLETNRILMQRTTPLGVAYFPYGRPKVPVFIRIEKEQKNKKYVVFQDPYLPPGEGYLVVLKKVPLKIGFETQRIMSSGVIPTIPVPSEVPYEAFHLHLSSNIHGTFDRLNVRKFAYGIRTKFAGRIKARRRWVLRRKMASRNKRRFGMGRWRGKRSVSLISVMRVTNNVQENTCFIRPLNITHLRMRVANLSLQSTTSTTTTPSPSFLYEEMESKDFDYFQYNSLL